MSGNYQVRSQGILDRNFKNIMEEKLSNKFKNSHEKFLPRKASL
jgi:hypothetical protein